MTLMRTERAIRTLVDADPQFVELCKMLYGPTVDADEVWQDVFGKFDSSKPTDPAAAAARKNRTQARIGLASNVLGITAAGAATNAALRDPALRTGEGEAGPVMRQLAKLPKLRKVPKGKLVRAGAAGALALQGANLGGDFVANRVLSRNAKGNVTKINLSELATGSLKQARSTIATHLGEAGTTVKPPPTPKAPKAPTAAPKPTDTGATKGRHRGDGQASGAKAFGTGVSQMASALTATTGRKAATGATVGAAAIAARRSQKAQGQQDMAMYAPPTWLGQSSVAKRDETRVTWQGEFSKFDEDKRLAFGWASVVEKDGMPVIDRQGDYMTAEDLETAAYDYVLKSRVGGDMHKRSGTNAAHKVSDMVESVVMTREKVEKMGLPANTPIGWWVGFKIHDEPTWQLIKKRERTGFSIHGRGRRRETSVDEAMNY